MNNSNNKKKLSLIFCCLFFLYFNLTYYSKKYNDIHKNKFNQNKKYLNINKELESKHDEEKEDNISMGVEDFKIREITKEQVPKNFLRVINRVKSLRGYLLYSENDVQYIVILGGEKPSSGYKINLEKFYEDDKGIKIIIRDIEPKKNMNYLQVLTYPYIILEYKGKYTNKLNVNNLKIKSIRGEKLKAIVTGALY